MLMRLTRVAQEIYCMFYCSCANPLTAIVRQLRSSNCIGDQAFSLWTTSVELYSVRPASVDHILLYCNSVER